MAICASWRTKSVRNIMYAPIRRDRKQDVHKYYECQCTADYIRENFPDLSEDKIQEYASEVRTYMDKYDSSEDEAIEAIMDAD